MLHQYFVLFITVTLALANNDQSFHRFHGHVLKTNGKYEIVTALAYSYKEPSVNADNILATGSWDENYNVTGWSVLQIKTSESQTNIDQVYSAGLLEGQLTRELILMQWQNTMVDICNNQTEFCTKLKEFFLIQLNWIYTQIDAYPNDEYWNQINSFLIQLNGLIDGYENKSRGPRKELDNPLGFLLFQLTPSIGDIATRLGLQNITRHDSCSVLIKILPDNKDVFVSHDTWVDYNSMLKVLKRYIMPLKRTTGAIVPGYDIVFSSYPGVLQSIDDFYMSGSSNLTIIETSINNYNKDLYSNISPISVPEWMRVLVANRLSTSGKEWVDNFFLFNDATYNNQWMITDFKKFTPGSPPKSGFLTVAEQMTIYHQSADMTGILNNNTYWASYNNIYFPDFRNLSGEDALVKEKGPALYSWQNSSRARIFRRDHSKVIDLPTMIHMMRYNDFQHDEISKCDCTPPYSAILTIAARCDLNIPNGTYPDELLGYRCGGATDAKITNYEMMQRSSLVAIAGPTADQQTPFVWSQSTCDKQSSHIGQPDVWNFPPLVPTWTLS